MEENFGNKQWSAFMSTPDVTPYDETGPEGVPVTPVSASGGSPQFVPPALPNLHTMRTGFDFRSTFDTLQANWIRVSQIYDRLHELLKIKLTRPLDRLERIEEFSLERELEEYR